VRHPAPSPGGDDGHVVAIVVPIATAPDDVQVRPCDAVPAGGGDPGPALCVVTPKRSMSGMTEPNPAVDRVSRAVRSGGPAAAERLAAQFVGCQSRFQ
jgi:hypothetical protein